MQKTQFEETKQASELDSDVAWHLQLSDWKFKIAVIDILRVIVEKVDNIQEQMDNGSKAIEILKKNEKEMLEIGNTNRNEECLWQAH